MRKGYFTPDGFRGLVDGKYMLFASESDYKDYISEKGDNNE